MRLKATYLNKKYYFFNGAEPETHRLEIVLCGTEKELEEYLKSVYLKCLGEIKIDH